MKFTNQKTKIAILAFLLVIFIQCLTFAAAENKSSETIQESKLVKMAPYLGYLKAHEDLQKPKVLLGGAIEVIVTQDQGGVHLALPDYRKLDPMVFGIPELPRAYGGTPVITGVPPQMREVENGKYTLLKAKTPFGHKNMVLPDGKYSLKAIDVTATDAAVTDDTVEMQASWKDKDGNTYKVKCNRVVPHGVEYPSFGGVLTNHILHGSSRIGTPLMPTEFVYVAFWGIGETLKNDKVMDSGRIVHCMLTEFVRTKDYELAFDDQITPTKLQMHLIVPPMIVKDGKFEKSPVKTGFMLENGQELPFWHVMFANLSINSQRLVTRAETESADPPADKKQFVIDMTNDLKFYPEKLEIDAGDTVEWKNTSDLIHTVTDDPALAINKNDAAMPNGVKPFRSGNIEPGKMYQHTFDKAGTYNYFCTLHEVEGMRGTIIVK
jgi:plastocyanin